MHDLNELYLSGKIATDAKIFNEENVDLSVVTFSLAVANNRNSADFFKIILFGKYAAAIHQYLIKGTSIVIKGHLSLNKWEDPETKKNRLEVQIQAREIKFFSKRLKKENE